MKPSTIKSENVLNGFSHHGELLLPDNELYPNIINEKTIEKIAKKIFYWIGIKPHGLHYRTSDGFNGYKNRTIFVNSDASAYLAAAIISKACLEYFYEIKKIDYTNENIERKLVYFGLGILIVNSFHSKNDTNNKFSEVFGIKKNQPEILQSISSKEFSNRLTEYIEKNQLNHKVIIEHLLPQARPYLSLSSKSPGKIKYEDYVLRVKKQQTRELYKAAGLIFSIFLIVILMMLLFASRPSKTPKEVLSAQEEIDKLKNSFKQCIETYNKKQLEYNLDDIYMVRQLDAQLIKCNSIKNKYDYQVQELEKLVNQK